MRRSRFTFLAALLLASLCFGAPAHAQPFWGVEIFGGWSSYALGDFNDSLTTANQSLGSNFEEIKSGGAGGFAVRLWPNENVLLRLAFEGLLAETDDAGVVFDVGPGAATVSATYFFPAEGGMRFGFGGGISSILIAGSLEGPGGKFDTEGSGFGVQGMGEVLVPFTKRWSLSGILGYRYAKVDDLEIAGSSTSTEMDYSGVIVRIGVAHDWK